MTSCVICSSTNGVGNTRPALCSRCAVLFNWFVSYFETEKEREFIALDRTFRELSVESLDYIEWVSEAEDTFGVFIADEKAETLRTVGDYLRFIAQHAQRWPDSLHDK